MKSIFVKLCITTAIGICISCNNSSTTDNTSTTSKDDTASNLQTAEKDTTQTYSNQAEYSYEPSVSTISGKITSEVFYGPPGFGEKPETDKKEEQYLLVLDKPIDVITKDDSNESKYKISKIQLLYNKDAVDMAKYTGSTVLLTGTFFSAHTGHHHTEVLMDVTALER